MLTCNERQRGAFGGNIGYVIRNDGVGGSSPSCGTNKIKRLAQIAQFPEPAGVNKSAAESAQKSQEKWGGLLDDAASALRNE